MRNVAFAIPGYVEKFLDSYQKNDRSAMLDQVKQMNIE